MRNVFGLFSLLLSLHSVGAQEPLVDGVTYFLGGGTQAAWLVKDGTVWVTDGTQRGTRNTGVPWGISSVANDRLIVYRQDRIDWLHSDGSTTVLTPPVSPDGFDDDADVPTIWRWLLNTQQAAYVEVYRWSLAGWVRDVAGVQGSSREPDLFGVYVSPGRVLVHSVGERAELLTDLLRPDWQSAWGITDIDAILSQPVAWSEGLAFPGYWMATQQDTVVVVPTRGLVQISPLPNHWDTPRYTNFDLREITPGFLVAHQSSFDEFATAGNGDDRAFHLPNDPAIALIWTTPSQQVLLLTGQPSGNAVLWLDRTTATWNPTSGFGAPDAIAFLGSLGSVSYLSVTVSGGRSLVRYDETTHSATPLITGMSWIAPEFAPFYGGFVVTMDDGVHGAELWSCDGTPSGTHMVADLQAGAASSSPSGFARLGDRLVFSAQSSAGLRIWSTDPIQMEWKRNPYSGHYYRLTEAATWQAARTQAHNWGGELATVRDATENAWLNETFGPANLWIGLADHQRSGTFSWASGEPVTYTAWCPNQPDRGAGETVVHITDYPGYCVGGWNDQDPLDSYPGVVERTSAPRPVEEFGSGCAPGPGQPIGTARWAGGWPRPGGTVDLEFVLGTGSLITGVLAIGVDATSFGGVPLPFDLASLGLPGCDLNIRIDDIIATWDGEYGFPSWFLPASLRLPNDPVLRGAVVFVQAIRLHSHFIPDSTTNALRITIGG